ncbi:MAG: rod shape-determining protein RodA [Bacteroidota bacterium]
MSSRGISRAKSIDWITFSIYLSLVVIGWLMIYAVGYDDKSTGGFFNFSTAFGKQTIWIGLSLSVLFLTFIIDHNFWRTFAYPLYGISLLLLVAVLFIGLKINGSRSWFSFLGFTLQPSELAKFCTSLVVASYLSASGINLKEIKTWVVAFGLLAMPAGLILLQPDAGSALVFSSFLILFYRQGLSSSLYIFGFTAATFFTLGLVFDPLLVTMAMVLIIALVMILNLKTRLYALISLVLMTVAAIYGSYRGWTLQAFAACFVYLLGFSLYLWKVRKGPLLVKLGALLFIGSFLAFSASFTFGLLESHQQDRINVWLKPSACDPQGSLYNVLQSKMAIGSGGLHGKGFLQGTMTKLNYVPEQMTDFIFCTIGEEQGFIGSLGIIALFFLLLWRIVAIAERQRSDFSRNYAYAVAGIIFVHFFVNIGMTMGLMPIIGIPLPFISKGGSSLLGFTLMIGVLLNLDKHRLRG